MKKTAKILVFLIIMIGLSSFCSYSQSVEKKLIVFLIDKVTLEDIDNMAFTKAISEKGAMGLMNTRSHGSSNEYSCALTIGSGTRAEAGYFSARSQNLDDESVLVYERRNGYITDSKEIGNLDIAKLKELNKENNFNPIIGALGSSLKMSNKKVSVIGNSDIDTREARLGILIGMDENGLVDYGTVGEDMNINASDYPYGLKTNYDMMMTKYKHLSTKSDLLILELGDLYRLEKYKANLSPEIYIGLREKVLSDMDLFINNVYNFIDINNSRIMVVSPTYSSFAAKSGKKLTPVIISGSGVEDGILSSDTTRREGIIGNVDIAPYIASFFSSNTNLFTGKPIYVLNKEDKLTYIKDLNNQTAFLYKNRLSVLFSFAIYEIIVSFLVFLAIQFGAKRRLKLYKFLEYLLLSNMAIPIALLVLPFVKAVNIYDAIIKIIIITILLTVIATFIRKETIDSIIFLSGLMCLLLTIDIMSGSGLIKMSFLGYDPIIGARYYGVGNEFMGILIGASMVFATAILDRYNANKGLSIIVFVIVTIAIGFPKFGANVGGTIAATFAFAFVMLKIFNSRLRFAHYVYIISAVFGFVLFIALVDLYFVESSSHLANAIKQINTSGPNVIYSIIKRKISMNLKLFGTTIWSKVLISSLVFLGVLFYRPFGISKKIFDRYRNLSKGLLGILIACIVSFLVNDSGVVASATAIIFLAMTLMYLVFNEIRTEGI